MVRKPLFRQVQLDVRVALLMGATIAIISAVMGVMVGLPLLFTTTAYQGNTPSLPPEAQMKLFILLLAYVLLVCLGVVVGACLFNRLIKR